MAHFGSPEWAHGFISRRFGLDDPSVYTDQPNEREVSEVLVNPNAPNNTQRNILVVDDEDMTRMLLTYLLEAQGYAVTSVANGEEALRVLTQQPVEIVMLDIMMPGISGLQVLSEVRKKYTKFDLPVLMITAKSESTDILEALKLGANDYITKPIDDFNIVAERVRNHLPVQVVPTVMDAPARTSASIPRLGFFCPACVSCTEHQDSFCNFCKAPRPLVGWSHTPSDDYPYLGRFIGRYRLTRFLGSGSAGVVYAALDREIGRTFAVKIVALKQHALEQNDPAFIPKSSTNTISKSLSTEIEIMARLQNPHVVKIYEAMRLDDGNAMILVMDLVRGKNLSHLMNTGQPIEPKRALEIVRQISQGLLEVHNEGMIHRDIKPDNIMLEELPMGDIFVKILDFSIAHILDRDRPSDSERFYGTPLYAAPEQIMGWSSINHRADIYSIGAMLYHMLAGRPPYDSENIGQLLKDHLYAPVPTLGHVIPNRLLRDALDGLLRRMMAKAVEGRFQSLKEVYERVESILSLIQKLEAV